VYISAGAAVSLWLTKDCVLAPKHVAFFKKFWNLPGGITIVLPELSVEMWGGGGVQGDKVCVEFRYIFNKKRYQIQ
jgi:hypothetical protein